MPTRPGRPEPSEVPEDDSDARWRRASIPATTALSNVTTPTSTHAHQLCLPSVARVIATPTAAARTGVTAVNTTTHAGHHQPPQTTPARHRHELRAPDHPRHQHKRTRHTDRRRRCPSDSRTANEHYV
jgi:hypothetical protein